MKIDENDTTIETGINILILDDEKEIQALLEWTIKEVIPYANITPAYTGADAISVITQKKFDIIMLDYHLPDMNGIDVIKSFNEQKIAVPVIFLTGVADEATALQALKLGAYEYIEKAGNYYELIPDLIKQTLRKSKIKRMKEKLEDGMREREMVLKVATEKLKKLSITDTLTGLYNRRYMDDRLLEELKRSKRYNDSISFMLIDLDYYKNLNDQYGHRFGDYVLKTVANLFKESCRETNIITRYGGDEFAIILPYTNVQDAEIIAKRITKVVESFQFVSYNLSARVTVSIGIASYPEDTESIDLDSIISMADSALYAAKSHGGNCCKRYDSLIIHPVSEDSLLNLNHNIDKLKGNMKRKMARFITQLLSHNVNGSKRYHRDFNMVRDMALSLSNKISIINKDRETLECSLLLFDIGMFNVKSDILENTSRLSIDDFAVIKKHPVLATDIMKRTGLFTDELPAVLYHHEHYDGRGYPYGIAADNIPLCSRIISIADAYEAMASGRPYKGKVSREDIKGEFIKKSGTQFDPYMVKKFLEII